MSVDDRRPRWMLTKHARISGARLARFGMRPDKITPEAWWHQIAQAAADLGLEPGGFDDWQPWPVPSQPVEDPR